MRQFYLYASYPVPFSPFAYLDAVIFHEKTKRYLTPSVSFTRGILGVFFFRESGFVSRRVRLLVCDELDGRGFGMKWIEKSALFRSLWHLM